MFKNKKESIVIAIVFTFILAISAIAIASSLYKGEDSEKVYSEKEKNVEVDFSIETLSESEKKEFILTKLSDQTKQEFGELKILRGETIDQPVEHVEKGSDKRLLLEDSKYLYKVSMRTGNIRTIGGNLFPDGPPSKTLSDNELRAQSETYLHQYAPAIENCKYVIQEQDYQDWSGMYRFSYDLVASNGIKTGYNVSIELYGDGSFAGFSMHEGNAKIALSKKAKLSKKEALKIAKDIIRSENSFFRTVTNFSVKQAELSVWDDILVWEIMIDDYDKSQTPAPAEQWISFGFWFKLDAKTGELVSSDFAK